MNISKIHPAFEDKRGEIIDILQNELIEHVTLISFKNGSIRGDHYHKLSTQYAFVIEGRFKILTRTPGSTTDIDIVSAGDLVHTPPLERHAYVALEDGRILVLTKGHRGGKDYEKDTFSLKEDESLVRNNLS